MVKIMENPINMDDLEVPLFSETSFLTDQTQKNKAAMFMDVLQIYHGVGQEMYAQNPCCRVIKTTEIPYGRLFGLNFM